MPCGNLLSFYTLAVSVPSCSHAPPLRLPCPERCCPWPFAGERRSEVAWATAMLAAMTPMTPSTAPPRTTHVLFSSSQSVSTLRSDWCAGPGGSVSNSSFADSCAGRRRRKHVGSVRRRVDGGAGKRTSAWKACRRSERSEGKEAKEELSGEQEHEREVKEASQEANAEIGLKMGSG
eukprot:6208305-Pleurochrysis_carterae.AAC.3